MNPPLTNDTKSLQKDWTAEIEEMQRKIAILSTRNSLSNNFLAARDEPYEEQVQTNKVTPPQGILVLNGGLVLGLVACPVVLTNGLNSNINIGTGIASTGRIYITGPTGAFSVGGLTGGVDGRMLVIVNGSSQAMTLTHEDASSTAANRIHANTSGTDHLTVHLGCILVWTSVISRWMLVGA